MPASKSFTYNGLTVGVQSDDPGHLLWLEEFLAPAFTVGAAATIDCMVAVETDDRRYRDTLHRSPGPAHAHADCFALDSGVVRLPVWSQSSVERIIFDEEYEVFYAVNHDASSVRILTGSRHRATRVALMRVVREFAMAASWARNRIVLHAAAFATAHTGVIIAGPKNAGKTSLLIWCLQASGARYLSNDRVVVDLGGPQPMLRGMPTIVTIRDQTLETFPELARRFEEAGYDHRVALCEAPPPRPDRAPETAVTLTPAQFCALLGAEMMAQCPGVVLLFPQVTEGGHGIALRRLAPVEAGQRLAQALFATRSEHPVSDVFVLPVDRQRIERANVDALWAALTARVRAYDCQLGSQAYRAARPTDFLQEIASPADHAAASA